MHLKSLIDPRVCAIIAMVCPVVLLLLPSVAAPALTDYDPLWTLISVMALGDFGWLGIIFFVFSAITVLAFAGALSGGFVTGKKTETAVKLLCAAAVCLVLLAFIDIDHVHGVWTLKRAVHWSIAGVGISAFLASFILIAFAMKSDAEWRGMYVLTLIISGLCIASGIILSLGVRAGYVALMERLVLTTGVIWVEALSWRIYRLAASSGR